jgi:hypothetical protein
MPVMPALHVEGTDAFMMLDEGSNREPAKWLPPELTTPNANEANDAFAMQNNFPIVLF